MWNAYNGKSEEQKREFGTYIDSSLEKMTEEAHRTFADGTGITIFRTPWMAATRGALWYAGLMNPAEVANTTLFCTLTNYFASGKVFSIFRDRLWRKIEPLDVLTKKQYDISYGVAAGSVEAIFSYLVMKYGFHINNTSSAITSAMGSVLTAVSGGPVGELIDTERDVLKVKLDDKEKRDLRSIFIENRSTANENNPFYKILNRSRRFRETKRKFYNGITEEKKKRIIHTLNGVTLGGIGALWAVYGKIPEIPSFLAGLLENH